MCLILPHIFDVASGDVGLCTFCGAVKLMRTRIRLLAQPKSMRSIIGATQREQQHGLA